MVFQLVRKIEHRPDSNHKPLYNPSPDERNSKKSKKKI